MITIILFLVKIIQLDRGELWFIEWTYGRANFIVRWREKYDPLRPPSALIYLPAAPQAWLLVAQLVYAPDLTYRLVFTLGAGHHSWFLYH